MSISNENKSDGLAGLIGQRVTFFTMNYIYTGKLVGVNKKDVKLEDGGIVYETGSFTDKAWKDYQKLPGDFYVRLSAVESFGVMK